MEDAEFVPLRKKLKRKTTGKEHNFVESYYANDKKDDWMNDAEIDQLRWRFGIEVDGDECPAPVTDFARLKIPVQLQSYLHDYGYKSPSPIQMQALPCILSGRDVIGIAETGSGKTLCYLLPLCILLATRHRPLSGAGPIALILVPTRELAQQIHQALTAMTTYLNFNSSTAGPSVLNPWQVNPAADQFRALVVCGGVPINEQIQDLQKGIDIIVATPGRLIHLSDNKKIDLTRITYLVMDEADRMLGMGMEEQLRKIVGLVTQTMLARQTLLWSATMPTALERLARSAVLNAITITIGVTGITNRNITHNVLVMSYVDKPKILLKTLRTTAYPPVIVFANSIATVNEVSLALKNEQFHVASLHSEKSQAYRFRVMTALKNGGVDVLVATDLASRGLDIPEVSHVINYDMPETIEDYIHRCGRTARFGRRGQASAFVTLDCKIVEDLQDILMAAKQEIPDQLMDSSRFGKKIIRTEFGDRPV